MNTVFIFLKSLKEQFRDILNLAMVLTITPVFIILFFLISSGGAVHYNISIVTDPTMSAEHRKEIELIIQEMSRVGAETSDAEFSFYTGDSYETAELKIEENKISMALVFPEQFFEALKSPAAYPLKELIFLGNPANAVYIRAASVSWMVMDSYISETSGIKQPVVIKEEAIGEGLHKSEFDNYIPGLLVISIILLVFSTAIFVAREKEYMLFTRYRLTPSSPGSYIFGNSFSFLVISVLSILLSVLCALCFGFSVSIGSLILILLVLLITSFSIIGIGFLTGIICKTSTQAYLLASFPFMLLMFFSGSIYPMQGIELFEIGGRMVHLFDFLPTVHAVNAMNKILLFNKNLSDIAYELIVLITQSMVYFFLGYIVLKKKFFNLKKG